MKTEREKKLSMRRFRRRLRERAKRERRIKKLQIEIGRLSERIYL